MARRHLAVHAGKPPAFDLADERDQRHLRRIRNPAEHRLAKEHPPERDAIQPADQVVIHPHLDGMGVAQVEEVRVRLGHLLRDPRAILTTRGAAQPSITCRKQRSSVTFSLPARIVLRSERDTCTSVVKSTMRGSGLHHNSGSSSPNQGKMP